LGYKSILRRLAEERKATNEHLCQQAKNEFGTDFDTMFSYMKNGQRHVKAKASDVARQYILLKGMNDNDNEEGDDYEAYVVSFVFRLLYSELFVSFQRDLYGNCIVI
jgi:hypothetical protein